MRNDTCGCCRPPAKPTPVKLDNRPGLSAIAYRVGTFSSFRQAMLQSIAGTPELAALRTRRSDDYAITILELWATVADILTFYQERIANEAFLRTANLRDSVLRLARLLDYQLRPGVAATAYLALTVEKDKQVQIPVGLRVQSVPGQDEKPQKFETLEAITADARLNRLRVLPAPVGVNPLAKGKTEAILTPGPDGLAVAEALAPGDHFLMFSQSAVEELTVREVRVEEDWLILAWSTPIQGTSWSVTSKTFKFTRMFRLFGYNAPPTYMKATEPSPGLIKWELKKLTPWDGTGIPGDDSYGLQSGTELHLDSRYEDLKVGSQLLVSDSGGQKKLVTVKAVDQNQCGLGALSDTVTKLTVDPGVADIKDRRQVLLYELEGPPIRFWGYAYPDEITSPTVYLPGRRIDEETAEIGRAIEDNAYQSGVRIGLKGIEVGRKVLLLDDRQTPVATVITGASLVGAEVTIGPTADDGTTVIELGLDSEHARVVTVSAPIASSLTLTNTTPQLSVTIGSIGPRTVRFASPPTSRANAASQLEAGLKEADPATAFAQARVLVMNNHLVVLPGLAGARAVFAPTIADRTTAAELGLDPEQAQVLTGLVSKALAPFPTLTEASPELSVTIGPVGPRIVTLNHRPSTVSETAELLKAALSVADPAPAFARAHVLVVDDRLLVLPGMVEEETQEYLVLNLQPKASLSLDAQSTVMLGNITLASHGETVEVEVVGDGDASVAFQRFTLKKNPVTFVSSASAGGTQNSLKVLMNDVLWRDVPSLHGRAPTDQVYTTRIADDGTMTIQFGDGNTGARPPSGRGNIVATYRQGVGLAGRVRANTLTTLLDRPVGLKAATNPAPAEGGADPETLDKARQNAPTTVRTFGRAVSLRDFEDLVTVSGEVAKARATWVWNGEAQVVHLTVAGQQGGTFSDDALARIHTSLTDQRDPNHTLFLGNFVRVPIVVVATLRVADTHVATAVEAAARAALLRALSFEALGFGQPLHLSDIYRVLQDVAGVVWVDIDLFHFKNRSSAYLAARGADKNPVQGHLRIYPARPNPVPPPVVLPAEQAWIEVPAQDITILTSGGLPA